MHEEQASNQVRTLSIEPPETLAETLGYGGQARKVGFFWGGGDEAYYHDGHLSTQAEWDAYLLFVQHPLIVPLLEGYNLGSSEEEATHWLLLDRQAQQIAIAPAQVAYCHLLAQWGLPTQEQVLVVDREDWNRLVAEVAARMECISQEQIMAQMFEHQHRVQELSAWLEMKWKEQHVSLRHSEKNKPSLADIRALATELEFDFRGGGEQDGTFDLDKRGNPSLGGTWFLLQVGIDDAYGYLIRYRHQLVQSDQAHGQL